jgi:hypothetical protein
MIPAMIAQFVGTLAGRAIVGGGLVAVLLGVYGCEVHKQRKIGVEREQSRVEAKGKQLDAKASNARRDAERRAPDSLREYLRD